MGVTNHDDLFVRITGRSIKYRCKVCGRTGYSLGRWQDACRRGHAPCLNGCGKMMSVLANGSPRRHPSHRCPARTMLGPRPRRFDTRTNPPLLPPTT